MINTAVVLVNFAKDDGGFGCDCNCGFCVVRGTPFERTPSQPTIQLVREFIKDFPSKSELVSINGGGEPLFRYEENEKPLVERNSEKLLRIMRAIKSTGKSIRLHTKLLSVFHDNYLDFLNLVDVVKFSMNNTISDEELTMINFLDSVNFIGEFKIQLSFIIGKNSDWKTDVPDIIERVGNKNIFLSFQSMVQDKYEMDHGEIFNSFKRNFGENSSFISYRPSVVDYGKVFLYGNKAYNGKLYRKEKNYSVIKEYCSN